MIWSWSDHWLTLPAAAWASAGIGPNSGASGCEHRRAFGGVLVVYHWRVKGRFTIHPDRARQNERGILHPESRVPQTVSVLPRSCA